MHIAASAPTAVVYARVSTDEQGQTGASVDAQVHELVDEVRRRGWVPHVIKEIGSAKSMNNRPGMAEALRMLARREAIALVAVRIDRISRSVSDFAQLMDRARKQKWSLVMTGMELDTTTPHGVAMANMLVTMAQYERELIGMRTKAGMEERARQGVHLGRARSLPLEVVKRVVAMRQDGETMQTIAEILNLDKVPTAAGSGEWTPSKIQSVLKSKTAQQIQKGEAVTVPSSQ